MGTSSPHHFGEVADERIRAVEPAEGRGLFEAECGLGSRRRERREDAA